MVTFCPAATACAFFTSAFSRVLRCSTSYMLSYTFHHLGSSARVVGNCSSRHTAEMRTSHAGEDQCRLPRG